MFVMMSTPMLSLNTMNGYWQSSRRPVPNWKKHPAERSINPKHCGFEPTQSSRSMPTTNNNNNNNNVPQLSCSASLPIIGPPDRIEANKNLNNSFKCNDGNGNDQTVSSSIPMASSLPNLSFLELPPSKTPVHMDSIDLYKRMQIKQDLASMKLDDSTKVDPNQSTKTDTMPATEAPKTNDRGQNRVRRKNSSMTPVLPDFEQMAILREQSEEPNEISPSKLEIKISSGTTDHNNDHDHDGRLINGDVPRENGTFESSNQRQTTARSLPPLNGDDLRLKIKLGNLEKSIDHNDDDDDEVLNGDNKAPRLSFCNSKGTKQESAAAWLAAATRQLSFCNNNNNQLIGTQSCRSAYNAQVELNANGREEIRKDLSLNHHTNTNLNENNNVNEVIQDKINPQIDIKSVACHSDKPLRKTSILRPPSKSFCDMNYVKKNVRFADSMGLKLENVVHYVITPQMVTRRYSSYNPPNYLSNAGWNTDSWCGGKVTPLSNENNKDNYKLCNLKANILNNSATDLAPRFQLAMMNFSNPSLNPDFNKKLFEKNVLLHSVTIAETTIYGIVSVVNRHFCKKVFVRYTFDNWVNHIEREANYMIGSHDGQTDKFSFVIYAHPKDFSGQTSPYRSPFYSNCSTNSRMYFAIRFVTGDCEEFWDNNDGQNYCLELRPFPMQTQ